MHKRLVNHCTIDFSIIPDGPILIKSGREGADPTNPDMEFVRTFHQGGWSIYLPGSSLKGAIRAHAERIVRTIGSETKPSNSSKLWANNPLTDKYTYLKDSAGNDLPPHEIYQKSSFTDQMFGNTSIASRVRIEDAYPVDAKQLYIEERNGVAIDRVFGSTVPGALFNYQVCTAGEFRTKIHLKNFTLAQLGLIGLVLRDLNDGWFGLGFAKSRGLGTVQVKYNSAVIQYPGCVIDDENKQIQLLGSENHWSWTYLLGVGEFLSQEEANKYGFQKPDKQDSPVRAESMDLGFGVQMKWEGDTQAGVQDLFMRGVRAWGELLGCTTS
ncbi:RAMP superfamily CRISPR-associated protein [Calothrix sp. UHCC 0171]|uniref:RAMP superfamily CRISPR-associated protein n=1 Tax=Calothrix sp. UHCC 0171 TaxID=3110245 RepID=UPI002B1F69D4|nr:RAMP superfamily CRISPR-associated protein [Calothrix sp. UHCC 0171]MEA5573546.1 RAMP superfamily CRISPR-associated protein [Calothrix sp. UHCC 0171]